MVFGSPDIQRQSPSDQDDLRAVIPIIAECTGGTLGGKSLRLVLAAELFLAGLIPALSAMQLSIIPVLVLMLLMPSSLIWELLRESSSLVVTDQWVIEYRGSHEVIRRLKSGLVSIRKTWLRRFYLNFQDGTKLLIRGHGPGKAMIVAYLARYLDKSREFGAAGKQIAVVSVNGREPLIAYSTLTVLGVAFNFATYRTMGVIYERPFVLTLFSTAFLLWTICAGSTTIIVTEHYVIKRRRGKEQLREPIEELIAIRNGFPFRANILEFRDGSNVRVPTLFSRTSANAKHYLMAKLRAAT